MQSITLVFPHQLFQQHPALTAERPVWLVEEFLFFRQYRFHKKKIAYHRATMQFYTAMLEKKKIQVTYIAATDKQCDIRLLLPAMVKKGIREIHLAYVVDDWLHRRLCKVADSCGITLHFYETPAFLNTMPGVKDFFDSKKQYFQTDFYTWQRKNRKLLLQPDGKPLGGKWTFDAENREKMPVGERLPVLRLPAQTKLVKEALQYADTYFADHYGAADELPYPVTHADAETWLNDFLQQRFAKFGVYEDAMVTGEHWLYHSVLTPMLNTGLLTPAQVLEKTLVFAAKQDVPLNSLEGFIRQITGWREFIRIVYEREGRKQRTRNYWNFTRKIPSMFWNGETGIAPLDEVIQKVVKLSYNHHIERLMVMGNFMLLCEFDPDEVYRWFMEMYIDAYDWVMVPNVYGMTQFADGGLMTTKPYISGSNYILKMSNHKKGPWCEIWDALFWRFMHVHRSFFLQNPRLGMLINTFDKMAAEKRNAHLQKAEAWLNNLDAILKKEVVS
jgi:deoxyribodipyrimidine photolyase-related protein